MNIDWRITANNLLAHGIRGHQICPLQVRNCVRRTHLRSCYGCAPLVVMLDLLAHPKHACSILPVLLLLPLLLPLLLLMLLMLLV